MIFDGVFIHHLIAELNHVLYKSRLEKIYQSDETSFLFVLYVKGERHYLALHLSPNHYGLYLTSETKSGQVSSQFLNTLKKHIEGGILESIVQYQTDRVITLKFTVYDLIEGPIAKELIFEAMGKHSNLLLVKDMIIIDTFKKMFFESGRQLLPQATFEYFPSDKKPFTEIDYQLIHSPQDLVNQYLGISPFIAQYLDEHPVPVLSIPVRPTRSITQNKDYVLDIFKDTDEKIYFNHISEMMDTKTVSSKPVLISHALFIQKQIQKAEKKHIQYEEMLKDAHDRIKDREIGDLIYQSGMNLLDKHASLDVNGTHISLDPTKTLNDNAQSYFKSYQKAKRSFQHIESQMKQNQELLDLFRDLETFVGFATPESLKDLEKELTPFGFKGNKMPKISKKQSQKPNIIKLEDQGIVYYIGKNNIQNEYVTHVVAQKEDTWFHVKDGAGAHVVVTTKTLTEPILRKAAMLAAYFSSMRESSSIPVDYTLVKHIKKIPGLPGYRVSYTKHSTIYIDIDPIQIKSFLKNV
jgi:predicted ribosome quality control (RQC) complex YloA/Tae2 family protein